MPNPRPAFFRELLPMKHVFLTLTIASCLTGFNVLADTPKQDPYARLDAFAQVLNVVEQNYVDTIDRTKIIDGAISGMIRALDPHSSYMTAAERRNFELRTGGQFVGIGVEIGFKEDVLRVIAPLPGGPAEKAGILSGDIILAIDGEDVSKMSLDHLVMRLQGEPGSTVRLLVKHPDVLSPRSYVVTRDIVKTEVTFSKLIDPHYGYVQLKSFGQGCADKVREEIESLERLTNNGLHGLVIDLRNNPGGFLNEATELVNMFLSKGLIVETRGRDGVVMQSYSASAGTRFDFPVAILINAGSASASEIVAGAMQAHRRALIVGTQSFGKASVQNMIRLKDGASLKLTVGRYYTPDGQSIQARGITPDIYVENAALIPTEDQQAMREKDLANALQPGQSDAFAQKHPATPMTNDLQLFSAYTALKAHELMQ